MLTANQMTIPIEFAEPFGPEKCKLARDENMALARRARRPKESMFFEANNEMVVDAVRRARMWNRLVVAGGNDTYHYRLKRNLPVW